MIENGFVVYIIIIIVSIMLLVLSFGFPFYGFSRKRWKGMVLGCLLQPFFFALVCFLCTFCILGYENYNIRKLKNAAMVTVRETMKQDSGQYVHTWYVKGDDECMFNEDKLVDEGNKSSTKEVGQLLFDVIPIDSQSVCIDDRIVVRFDPKTHSVTAMDYDTPMEVVSVDWDKVNEYLGKKGD